MFNFFDEIKKNVKRIKDKKLLGFNIINISGEILYVEGQLGVLSLSKENISFKVSGGVIVVDGQDLYLVEMSETTLKIAGKIKKVEQL